jgi:hypothetical protein
MGYPLRGVGCRVSSGGSPHETQILSIAADGSEGDGRGRTPRRGEGPRGLVWGGVYELCPDDLLAELNGQADQARITALMKRYRAQKR